MDEWPSIHNGRHALFTAKQNSGRAIGWEGVFEFLCQGRLPALPRSRKATREGTPQPILAGIQACFTFCASTAIIRHGGFHLHSRQLHHSVEKPWTSQHCGAVCTSAISPAQADQVTAVEERLCRAVLILVRVGFS